METETYSLEHSLTLEPRLPTVLGMPGIGTGYNRTTSTAVGSSTPLSFGPKKALCKEGLQETCTEFIHNGTSVPTSISEDLVEAAIPTITTPHPSGNGEHTLFTSITCGKCEYNSQNTTCSQDKIPRMIMEKIT